MKRALFTVLSLLPIGFLSSSSLLLSMDAEDEAPSLQQTLFGAIQNNEINAVKGIIAEAPQLKDSLDEGGYTPLHAAVVFDRPEILQFLLDKHANPNIRATDAGFEESPLWYATHPKGVHLIAPLLAAGAHPYAGCFGAAVYHNRPDIITQLAKKSSRDINSLVSGANTPLHMATSTGSTACLEALLTAGADPNVVNKWGNSPLLCAIRPEKDIRATEALLAAGARVDHRCLCAAAAHRLPEITKKLVQAKSFRPAMLNQPGKDIVSDADIRTALSWTTWDAAVAHTQILVDAGADPCALDDTNEHGSRTSAWHNAINWDDHAASIALAHVLLTHKIPGKEPVFVAPHVQYNAEEFAHFENPAVLQLIQQRKLVQEATHKLDTLAIRALYKKVYTEEGSTWVGKIPPHCITQIRGYLDRPAQAWKQLVSLPEAAKQQQLAYYEQVAAHGIARKIQDRAQRLTAYKTPLYYAVWTLKFMRKESDFYSQQKNLSYGKTAHYWFTSFFAHPVMTPVTAGIGFCMGTVVCGYAWAKSVFNRMIRRA